MPQSFYDRLQHSWNAFRNKDPVTSEAYRSPAYRQDYDIGPVSWVPPHRPVVSFATDKTIAVAIYNRIATDCTRVRFEHVKTDDNKRYLETIDSGLNYILNYEANIDQSSQAFFHDLIFSMLDEGVVAGVPVDTTINPNISGSYDIKTMRIGRILDWYPRKVKVELYNEATGRKEPIILDKSYVAIIENPFYSVMNEKNSVLKRLVAKLALLDIVDQQANSPKLDMIVQLPYAVKSKTQEERAKERVRSLENQLEHNKLGIGYIDSTERITQLNRTVDNHLLSQIENLTSTLYSQLGITAEIMNGTASEETMLNYINRTINVILDAIVEEFERKFLTKTARSQNQAIMYFRDPFAFTTSSTMADVADKFTRNEVLVPNEVRGYMGIKPSGDPTSDMMGNRNLYGTVPPADGYVDDGTYGEEGDQEEDFQPEVQLEFE